MSPFLSVTEIVPNMWAARAPTGSKGIWRAKNSAGPTMNRESTISAT
jgi:hypothetical protein